jgi:hypothetical protein
MFQLRSYEDEACLRQAAALAEAERDRLIRLALEARRQRRTREFRRTGRAAAAWRAVACWCGAMLVHLGEWLRARAGVEEVVASQVGGRPACATAPAPG